MDRLVYYLLSAVAALIALTVHEYCHGYAAYRLGDNTAKNMGRLTLNPIKHIDPYGAICMVLFHIGWAKPVPVNARNFKDPKKGFAITAAAGPASNLILGFFSALIYLVVFALVKDLTFTSKTFGYLLISNTLYFLYIFHSINIGLAIYECPEAAEAISDGDVISSDSDTGIIINETTGKTYSTKPFPPFIAQIIADGGLMESIKKGHFK